MAKSKKIMLSAILASLGLHLLIFLMYFIPYYVMEVDANSGGPKIYEYARYFVMRFFEFAFPAVTCAFVYFSESSQKWLKVALKCFLIALGRLIYLIPDYYLQFMRANIGDSGDALLLSGIFSAYFLILLWIQIMLFYAALCLVATFLSYRKSIKELTPQKREKLTKDDKKAMLLCAKLEIDAHPEIGGAFDFSYALCAGLFAPAIIQFFLYLIPEIISAVSYIIEKDYSVGEILYMIVSFLFIFTTMMVTYLINHKLASALCEKEVEAE